MKSTWFQPEARHAGIRGLIAMATLAGSVVMSRSSGRLQSPARFAWGSTWD
ncbi:hypothetical protein CA85_51860 [Allorhodopirellula solitaria]|uniref:Uncharacterized protein n=1 Tax=Allorhodopirellula solitaria TaxID=2527987 RepID=A0A5C5WNT8_9BACT|nr:hypothetical protein [Allorhodopirellula solitaria]TWT51779.1 hypothetical protein CA85_51860 [Allorhodopirellula solitaria]